MSFRHHYRRAQVGIIIIACAALVAITALADDTPLPAADTPTPPIEATIEATDPPIPATDTPMTDVPSPTADIIVLADDTPVPTSTDLVSVTPEPTLTLPPASDTPEDSIPTNTPEASLTPFVTGPDFGVIPFPYAYSANFEAGIPAELLFDQFWAVVNLPVPYGQAIQSPGASIVLYVPATFVEGAVDASFDINQGTAGLLWGEYDVQLSADSTVTLSHDGVAIQTETIDQTNSSWNYLRLTVTEASIVVMLNGIDKISISPVEPLSPASVGFWSGASSMARIDNFGLYGIPITEPATPVPSDTPELPTETLVPSLTPAPSNTPITLADGPILMFPKGGTFTGGITFNWMPATPAGIIVTDYEVMVSQSSAFETNIVDTSISASIVPRYLFLPMSGQDHVMHYWRVRGLSNGMPVTNWSGTNSFDVLTAIAAQPVITSPLLYDIIDNVRPTITWRPVSSASKYEVAVVDSETGVDYGPHQTVTDAQYTLPYNLPQRNITFYVRAGNDLGWSDWAHVGVLILLGNTPAQNSVVTSAQPTFAWTAVPNAVNYMLQVDNDADFSSPLIDVTTTDASYTPGSDETILTVNGVYYWRVGASNVAYSDIGFAHGFFVSLPNPAFLAQPVITSPTASETIHNVRPTITWDPVPAATKYEVAVVDTATGVDYAPHQPVIETQFTLPYNLPQRDITFYVRAGNDDAWSEWSVVSVTILLATAPAHKSTITTPQPTFTWGTVPEAADYTLQVDDDDDFSSPLIERTTTDTSYTLTEDEALLNLNGQYYWRVSASNEAYPDTGLAYILGNGLSAPAQPVITSPVQNEVIGTLRPTITWEPVPDATRYQIMVVDAETGVEYVPRQTLTETQLTLTENLPQRYINFYVRAGNDDVWGEWSYISAFVVLGDMPLYDSTIRTMQPTFTWPVVQGAVNYTLQVDDEYDFATPLIERTTTDTSYTLTEDEALPQPNVRYYWRLSASNVEYPPYGFVRIFNVSDSEFAQPVITSPVQNEVVGTVRPTITWEPVPDAMRYEVAVIDAETGVEYAAHDIVTETQFTLPYNLPQRYITFSVRAGSDDAWSEWSSVTAFIVLGSMPLYDGTIPTTQPTFTWPAVPEAVSYTLQVDDDYEFGTPLVEHTTTDTSYTLTKAEALPDANGQYYWRLAASNLDYPAYGFVRIFTVGVPSPAQPVITSPLQDEVIGTVRPTITWEPVPDATWYEVMVTDAETGIEYVPIQTVTEPQFTLLENLPQRSINVSVRAGNDDAWGDWSYVSAFVVLGSTPLYETNIATTRPTFTWPAVPGAVSYTLQIDDEIDFVTPLIERTTTDTSYTLTESEMLPYANARYYWRLSASNLEYPPYGFDRFFDVDAPAPATPVITSPLPDTTLGIVRPTITWLPVPGAVGYEVATVDPETGIDYVPHLPVIGTQFTFPYNLPQTQVDVYVRARNDVAWSDWAYLGLKIVLGSSPIYDSIVTTTRPAFKWSAVPGATNYTLQVDNDADFSSPFITRTTSAISYTPTVAEALPDPVVRYYWRVAASNLDYPAPPLARTFINGATVAPTNLSASHVGETTPAALFGRGEIQLRWDAPSPVPYGYEVEYSQTSDFSAILIHPTTLDPWISFAGVDLPAGKIYWRVRTIYNPEFASIGKWSSLKGFTLDLTPPSEPVIKAPTASVVVHTVRPTFSWNASTGAASYRIEMYDAQTNLLAPGFPKTVTGTSYVIPTSEMPLHQTQTYGYYWHVTAIDAARNASPPSSDGFFTVFSGLTPILGQTVADSTPRFTWQAVAGTGVAPWRLEIGTSPQMDTLVYASPELAESATSFTVPSVDALPVGLYYWRVYRVTEETSSILGQMMSISP